MNEVNKSHRRLQSTPAMTSTLAPTTSPVRSRLFANTSTRNGTTKPPTISNQKNGDVGPLVMSASVSAPAAPG